MQLDLSGKLKSAKEALLLAESKHENCRSELIHSQNHSAEITLQLEKIKEAHAHEIQIMKLEQEKEIIKANGEMRIVSDNLESTKAALEEQVEAAKLSKKEFENELYEVKSESDDKIMNYSQRLSALSERSATQAVRIDDLNETLEKSKADLKGYVASLSESRYETGELTVKLQFTQEALNTELEKPEPPKPPTFYNYLIDLNLENNDKLAVELSNINKEMSQQLNNAYLLYKTKFL